MRELRLVGAHQIGGGVDHRPVELEDGGRPRGERLREAPDLGIEPHAQERVVLLPGALEPLRESAHATRGAPARARLRRCTSSIDTAAGVTPGMRPAWPTVAGRTSVESLAHLVRQAGELRIVEVLRQSRFLVARGARDLFLLPLDVARVAGAHLDLGADLRRQPRIDRQRRVALARVRTGEPLRRARELEERFVAHLRSPQQLEGRGVLGEGRGGHAGGPVGRHLRGLQAQLLQPLDLEVGEVLLDLVEAPALIVDQTQLAPDRREARVGVVFA